MHAYMRQEDSICDAKCVSACLQTTGPPLKSQKFLSSLVWQKKYNFI